MLGRKLHINIAELVCAMESPEHDDGQFILDMEAGEVFYLSQDEISSQDCELARRILADPSRYNEIPSIGDQVTQDTMKEFAESVGDPQLAASLVNALRDQNAIVQFRMLLSEYPELRAEWTSFRNHAVLAKARTWLAGLGVELVSDDDDDVHAEAG